MKKALAVTDIVYSWRSGQAVSSFKSKMFEYSDLTDRSEVGSHALIIRKMILIYYVINTLVSVRPCAF